MAWSYVLKQISSKNGEDVLTATGAKVAFHVGIPADNNEIGVSYRDAVLESAAPSMIRDLENRFPSQYAKLQAGETVEIIEEVDYADMHDSVIQKMAAISIRAASIEADVIDILKMEYDLSGLVIDD